MIIDKPIQPIIRRRLKNIHQWKTVKSGHSKSLTRWGYASTVTLEKGERMRDKMAACFAGVKSKLNQDIPGIIFNAPEVFPVNHAQCVVLITGWKPEMIMLNS